MTNAIALLVGLTRVDPNAPDYKPMGEGAREEGISGCEIDVASMESLLLKVRAPGFVIHKLLTEKATSKSILDQIFSAASSLKQGDFFFFFFSGHGDKVADRNGDESDKIDEALAAFDRRILDDELAPLWSKFPPGVRILMISDTCNAGSNFRGPVRQPPRIIKPPLQIGASLIHIAATEDGTNAQARDKGGDFTNALLQVWNDGSFQGDYQKLFDETVTRVKERQKGDLEKNSPVFNQDGPNAATFVKEQAFAV